MGEVQFIGPRAVWRWAVQAIGHFVHSYEASIWAILAFGLLMTALGLRVRWPNDGQRD